MAREGQPRFPRSDLPADLGSMVRRARLEAGLSRREVAAQVPMASRTLARIERGDQLPLPATLRGIARAIGVHLSRLSIEWGSADFERSRYGTESPGVVIRQIRERLGLSQETIADAAGVSVSTISRFERALHAPRDLTRVAADYSLEITSDGLARALGFGSAEELTEVCQRTTVE